MTPAERYRKVTATFTQRVREVPADAWENPAPCEGWVARDVVRHLVDWLPSYFCERWRIVIREHPSVDEDPLAAWEAVAAAFAAAFDDPAVAQRVVEGTPMGPQTFEDCFNAIGTNDIFLHTWDLARAAGLDERLDPDEVHEMLAGMEPWDEALRSSGHYGPRVEVPPDADEQTRLIAFIGRQP